MTHVLLDSRKRSLAVCVALGLPFMSFGCTALDDDYYPELIEATAEPPPADGSTRAEPGSTPLEPSTPELGTTAEPVDVSAPAAPAASAEGEGSSELSDDADLATPSEAEEPGVVALLPEALEPATPTTPDVSATPIITENTPDGEAGPRAPETPVAIDVLDAQGGECSNGFGEFGAPERVFIEGLDAEVRAPSITSDGLLLYFSATVGSVVSIYEAARASTASAVFGSVEPVSELETAGRDGTPFVSLDGQRIYFYSNRQDAADLDLWLAAREPETGRFAAPLVLSELNTRAYELLPWLTPDELMITFVSTRPTRAGSSDIWYATRTSRDVPFGAPALAASLNSDGDEGRAALSADGLNAFFSSDREGSLDLFAASRAERDLPFSTPVAIERLNSASTDHDVALSADGREIFFASTRDGVSAIWRALRSCA